MSSPDLVSPDAHPHADLQILLDLDGGAGHGFPQSEGSDPRLGDASAGNRGVQTPAPRRSVNTVNATVTCNRSHAITAELEVLDQDPEGAIVAQHTDSGGWSLHVQGGYLQYHYDFMGLLRSTVTAIAPIPCGLHTVRVEFTYDRRGVGKSGWVFLYLDGRKVGEGRVLRTYTTFLTIDRTLEVGRSSISRGYCGRAFNGAIRWVQIDVERSGGGGGTRAFETVYRNPSVRAAARPGPDSAAPTPSGSDRRPT